ncbi:MAG: histidine kinase [Bacteroidales bacterium]|nr:histidine kinase [Bacteroidales bacterium]
MLKRAAVLIISILIGLVILAYLLFSQIGFIPKPNEYPLLYAVAAGISAIVGAALHLANHWLLNRVIPWHGGVFFRFLSQLFLDFLIVSGLTLLCFWLLNDYVLALLPQGLNVDVFEVLARLFILALLTVATYTIVDFALYSFNSYSQEQVKAITQRREQLELQFEALKSQLSPHYLFNNLNTVYSLIHTNTTQAEEYIRMLVQTYQYILATNDVKLVPFSREVSFAEVYCKMLAVRFGNAIAISVSVDSAALQTLIPPLSLQILIENAVKHNSFSSDNPLHVSIVANEYNVTVTNNLSPVQAKADSFRIGLDNVRRRYAQFTSRSIVVQASKQFVVKLPVLHLQNSYRNER